MAIVARRTKTLFLPVIRGIYPATLTQAVTTSVRQATERLKLNAIFPDRALGKDGVLRSDDDIAAYYDQWRGDLADIRALVVISGDFMRERAVQDTVRLLPEDVPVFLMVNNDDPMNQTDGKVGDALCGSLSVHHNLRMLGRRLLRACRINTQLPEVVDERLAAYDRIAAGAETLRNMRIACLGVNPNEFATTFTNQLRLFELGVSLHTYELLTLWGDTALARMPACDGSSVSGDFGTVRLTRPIARDDARVADVIARYRSELGNVPDDEAKLDLMARCFLWLQDTFEADRIDAGAIHCWGEFARFFGFAPCSFAMMANLILKKPVVCEVDICHAIVAGLAWEMTGEAGVILDINNNGWDPRVFNVFHCSQTPTNWLTGDVALSDYGTVSGHVAPVPFTAISAATTSMDAVATVFQGRFLPENPGPRGSSGWAFVPNLPQVLEAIEACGIHHFVALKGSLADDVADLLAFRGFRVDNCAVPVGSAEEVAADLPPLSEASAAACPVFSG